MDYLPEQTVAIAPMKFTCHPSMYPPSDLQCPIFSPKDASDVSHLSCVDPNLTPSVYYTSPYATFEHFPYLSTTNDVNYSVYANQISEQKDTIHHLPTNANSDEVGLGIHIHNRSVTSTHGRSRGSRTAVYDDYASSKGRTVWFWETILFVIAFEIVSRPFCTACDF